MPFASSALMDPISKGFVADIHRFIKAEGVDLVHFVAGERKDDVALSYLADHDGTEGVLFVGRAQEKTKVFRTEKRRNPDTGSTYPWIVTASAIVNHFYVYAFDDDFGPFFIKFGTYFPYTARCCLNGHHFAQRQATKAGIAFEALDNGFASCEDPAALQAICDSLTPERIDAFVRKWLARLPHPFTAADRRAGYRYDISVLQAEFSLTQVIDRPLSGRVFFEEVIRDNLDIGRPDRVSLVFDRRIVARGKFATPGRFCTRVITEGVTPSLHVDYKRTKVKQYHIIWIGPAGTVARQGFVRQRHVVEGHGNRWRRDDQKSSCPDPRERRAPNIRATWSRSWRFSSRSRRAWSWRASSCWRRDSADACWAAGVVGLGAPGRPGRSRSISARTTGWRYSHARDTEAVSATDTKVMGTPERSRRLSAS